MWPWGPKNSGNFCRTSQKACCPIWSSLTRRNFTSSKLLTRKTIEFGCPHPWLKEELSPDTKIRSLWWFGSGDRNREIPAPFCSNWSEIELWAVCLRHSGGLSAALGQATLQRRTVDPPTGFGTLPWFKIYPIMDSEENPLISKEDWPVWSPNLNPLDYSIWSILEKRVCSTPHQTLESLKAKLMKEWDAIPQETLCAACDSYPDR